MWGRESLDCSFVVRLKAVDLLFTASKHLLSISERTLAPIFLSYGAGSLRCITAPTTWYKAHALSEAVFSKDVPCVHINISFIPEGSLSNSMRRRSTPEGKSEPRNVDEEHADSS
jgi:hypothetical protein